VRQSASYIWRHQTHTKNHYNNHKESSAVCLNYRHAPRLVDKHLGLVHQVVRIPTIFSPALIAATEGTIYNSRISYCFQLLTAVIGTLYRSHEKFTISCTDVVICSTITIGHTTICMQNVCGVSHLQMGSALSTSRSLFQPPICAVSKFENIVIHPPLLVIAIHSMTLSPTYFRIVPTTECRPFQTNYWH